MSNKSNNSSLLIDKPNLITTMSFILNQVLADRNMSQRELSRKSGITQAQISMICKGQQSPSLTTIERIADALEIEVVDLFDRENIHKVKCPHCGNEITMKIETKNRIKVIK